MKVVHICGTFETGGITTFVRSLADLNKLSSVKHDIALVFADHQGPFPPMTKVHELQKHLKKPLEFFKATRYLSREYDGIMFHTQHPAVVFPFLWMKNNYLVFQHGMNLGRGPAAKRIIKKIWFSILPTLLNARVVFSTTFAAEKAKKRGIRIPSKRKVIIPFGIRLSDRPAEKKNRERPKEEIVVGAAGRLAKIKRLDLLILSLLDYEGKTKIRLKIAGAGPEKSKLLELAAAAKGNAVRFEFFGELEDMEPFYEDLDLFVFPSQGESLGLVVPEALSRAVPVAVFPDVGGALPMIQDGKNGFIMNDGVAGLQELWRRLDQNPKILSDLYRHISKMDLSEYDIARTRSRLEDLIAS